METAQFEIDNSEGPVKLAGPWPSSVARAEIRLRCERGNVYIGGEDDPLLLDTGYRMRTNEILSLALPPDNEVWALAQGNNRRMHVLVVFN